MNENLSNFTFYNYQTKETQSVVAKSWDDAWRQLGIRFGSPFLRGTYQPYGNPIPVGSTGKHAEPSNERAKFGTGFPVIFGTSR